MIQEVTSSTPPESASPRMKVPRLPVIELFTPPKALVLCVVCEAAAALPASERVLRPTMSVR